MEQVLQFLNECGVFYVATTENNQPRVRPFGAVMVFEEKLYICTNNTKKVYAQMLANPLVEMSGTSGGRWIRVEGKVAADHRTEAKIAMLNACPGLSNMYKPDDAIFEVLKFTEGKATIYGYASDPVEISLS